MPESRPTKGDGSKVRHEPVLEDFVTESDGLFYRPVLKDEEYDAYLSDAGTLVNATLGGTEILLVPLSGFTVAGEARDWNDCNFSHHCTGRNKDSRPKMFIYSVNDGVGKIARELRSHGIAVLNAKRILKLLGIYFSFPRPRRFRLCGKTAWQGENYRAQRAWRQKDVYCFRAEGDEFGQACHGYDQTAILKALRSKRLLGVFSFLPLPDAARQLPARRRGGRGGPLERWQTPVHQGPYAVPGPLGA